MPASQMAFRAFARLANKVTVMTVSESTVEAGKCYVTGLSEQRRVVQATTTKVTYEILSSSSNDGRSVTVSREKFAAEVDREIACPG